MWNAKHWIDTWGRLISLVGDSDRSDRARLLRPTILAWNEIFSADVYCICSAFIIYCNLWIILYIPELLIYLLLRQAYTLTLLTPTRSLPQLRHAHSNNSDMLASTPTLTYSLPLQLSHAHSNNTDIQASTPTVPYSLPLQLWHAHFHHWSYCSHNSDIFIFQPLICFVSLLWHGHSHLSNNLASLTASRELWIWLCR